MIRAARWIAFGALAYPIGHALGHVLHNRYVITLKESQP